MKPLTHFQRATLEKLQAKFEASAQRTYGFWSSSIGPRQAAVCRRVLGPAGLVHIDRQVENCFRYSITKAGQAAIGATVSLSGMTEEEIIKDLESCRASTIAENPSDYQKELAELHDDVWDLDSEIKKYVGKRFFLTARYCQVQLEKVLRRIEEIEAENGLPPSFTRSDNKRTIA